MNKLQLENSLKQLAKKQAKEILIDCIMLDDLNKALSDIRAELLYHYTSDEFLYAICDFLYKGIKFSLHGGIWEEKDIWYSNIIIRLV